MRARLLPALVLLLAGCSGTALGDLASMAGVGGSAGNGPEGPVSPPSLSGAPSACYHATWALQPETAWSEENMHNMGLGRGQELEYLGSEGDAWLTLDPDGTYQWSLNRFAVTLRGNADSSTPTDVTVHMHGMIYGTAVPGAGTSTLDMQVNAPGTPETRLTAYADVAGGGMGSLGRINLDVNRIFRANEWTSMVECSARALTVTTAAEDSGALQNARYTKVR